MEPEKLTESLKEWVAVSLTLVELVPNATIQELIDYVQGVTTSHVAASVLDSWAVPPEEVKKPAVFRNRG